MIARILQIPMALLSNTTSRIARVLTAVAAIVTFVAVVPAPAIAVPTLQLDIQGATYNSLTKTIVATSDPFTLYALLVPDSAARLTHTYYLAAALVPKTGPAPADLGSYTVSSTTPFTYAPPANATPTYSKHINVTADMTYGIPPIEANGTAGHDGGDLGAHGIYNTFFGEFAFQFDTAQRANVYNSQDVNPHTGPTTNANGGMYWVAFQIDTRNMDPGYAIHFDLYNEQYRNNGDIDVKTFAPFSHDAQGLPATTPTSSVVPVPASLVLVVLGVLMTIAIRNAQLRRVAFIAIQRTVRG